MYVKKLFAPLLCLVVLLAFAAIPVSAAGGQVIDSLGMFTDEQLAELNSAIEEAEAASEGVRFYIVTAEDSYYDSEMPAVCGETTADDLCILLIEDDLYYTLYTYGLAYDRISDGEVNDILDDSEVYSNIKTGRVFEGALRFLELTPATVAVPYGTIITVGIMIGIVAAGITLAIIISKYKMKLRPTNYPLDKYARLDLTGQEDHFIGKHVSVVVTSSGSSGSGRSGGGGGGGGARGRR